LQRVVRDRDSGVSAALGVEAREPKHLVHVPTGVVVAVHRAGDVELSPAADEIPRGAEDRVGGAVGIGAAVSLRVDSPACPSRRHELHPADRSGRARTEVRAEVGLDLVDRAEYLPRDAVGIAGRLPDRAERGERVRSGRRRLRAREREHAAAGARLLRLSDTERVRVRPAREGKGEHEGCPEEGEKTPHGYCWPATRSLGSSVTSSAVSSSVDTGSAASSADSRCGPRSATVSTAFCLTARSSAMRKSWRFEAALAATSRSTFSSSTSWISAL